MKLAVRVFSSLLVQNIDIYLYDSTGAFVLPSGDNSCIPFSAHVDHGSWVRDPKCMHCHVSNVQIDMDSSVCDSGLDSDKLPFVKMRSGRTASKIN